MMLCVHYSGPIAILFHCLAYSETVSVAKPLKLSNLCLVDPFQALFECFYCTFH